MTIEIKRNAEETTIELAGRLDTTTAPALDKTIHEDIEGTKSLVFDFAFGILINIDIKRKI